MNWLEKLKTGLLQEQRGISLIEIVIALGILAFIGVGFLTGLWTISRSTGIYDQRVTASVLAQSQIEQIKAMNYDPAGNYPVLVTPPTGYSVTVAAVLVETGKQEVTVAVSSGGEGVLNIKTTKTNW